MVRTAWQTCALDQSGAVNHAQERHLQTICSAKNNSSSETQGDCHTDEEPVREAVHDHRNDEGVRNLIA